MSDEIWKTTKCEQCEDLEDRIRELEAELQKWKAIAEAEAKIANETFLKLTEGIKEETSE